MARSPEQILLDSMAAISPGERLPSLQALAAESGISRRRLRDAAGRLHEKGVVILKPRSGIWKPGGRPPHPRRHSHERLYTALKQRICAGHYTDGTALPRRATVCALDHVSAQTVSRAYKMLEHDKLVYRKGKRWIVGRKQEVRVSEQQPVILLLMQDEHGWRGIHQSERTASFCRSFLSLVQENAVYVEPVFFDNQRSPSLVFAGGPVQIAERIEELGSRYRGTLLVDYSTRHEERERCLATLRAAHRPIVCFDRHGIETAGIPAGGRLVTICRFNERKAVRYALEVLFNAGHRRVGFPILWSASWRPARRRVVLEEAVRFDGLKILSNSDVTDLIDIESDERIADILVGLQKKHIPAVQRVLVYLLRIVERHRFVLPGSDKTALLSYRDIKSLLHLLSDPSRKFSTPHSYLLRLTVLMHQFLGDRRPTAILSPCDEDALKIFYWLQAARIPVPEKMTLLSFDNYTDLIPLPVSTVDFGFGYLGFAAFHLIMDDGIVRRPGSGILSSRPNLIDRGSIQAPRTGHQSSPLS